MVAAEPVHFLLPVQGYTPDQLRGHQYLQEVAVPVQEAGRQAEVAAGEVRPRLPRLPRGRACQRLDPVGWEHSHDLHRARAGEEEEEDSWDTRGGWGRWAREEVRIRAYRRRSRRGDVEGRGMGRGPEERGEQEDEGARREREREREEGRLGDARGREPVGEQEGEGAHMVAGEQEEQEEDQGGRGMAEEDRDGYSCRPAAAEEDQEQEQVGEAWAS